MGEKRGTPSHLDVDHRHRLLTVFAHSGHATGGITPRYRSSAILCAAEVFAEQGRLTRALSRAGRCATAAVVAVA